MYPTRGVLDWKMNQGIIYLLQHPSFEAEARLGSASFLSTLVLHLLNPLSKNGWSQPPFAQPKSLHSGLFSSQKPSLNSLTKPDSTYVPPAPLTSPEHFPLQSFYIYLCNYLITQDSGFNFNVSLSH